MAELWSHLHSSALYLRLYFNSGLIRADDIASTCPAAFRDMTVLLPVSSVGSDAVLVALLWSPDDQTPVPSLDDARDGEDDF